MLVLANDDLEVAIDPDRGSSVLAFRARVERGWIDLMPDTRHGRSELAAASFVMAPYSNRIADGAFDFGGTRYQLANAENHAIHGDVRKRRWDVLAGGDRSARVAILAAGVNWPWPFEVEMDLRLDGPVFRTEMSLTNRAPGPMPAGFGLHPYFVRAPTTPGEPVLLRFAVAGVYPDAYGTRIPSGPAEPPAWDFAAEQALDPEAFIDACAHGFGGTASIRWPSSGVGLRLDASPELGHLVLYNPPKPYFALEPVSNANDGVNLFARGDGTSGVRVLAPGEALRAWVEMRVERG